VERGFSIEDIERGLVTLRRRLDEVKALAASGVRFDDPRVRTVAENIRDAVREVFGADSPEYQRHQGHRIWHGPLRMNMHPSEQQASFEAGVPHSVELLENFIRRLEEKKADFAPDTTGRVRMAFEGLDLHPRIAAVCADLYRDGHYRNAVLDASVALVNFVREKSRRHDLDGAKLMSTVFSKNNPILAFNAMAEQTDEDEQEGMMHLFMGAVLALRNPRAHALLDDSPEMALEHIGLISLLAKQLDGAKRRTP